MEDCFRKMGEKTMYLINKLHATRYTLYAIFIAVVAGCGGPYVKPTAELYWPAPPDPPRVKWVDQWSNRYDFEQPNRFLSFLLGSESVDHLKRPAGIVADTEGTIYVADTDTAVIFAFDIKRKALRLLGEGTFNAPISLAIDNKRGVLFVTDSKQNRLIGLEKDSGRVVFSVGAPGEFKNASGVAYDDETERIYVSDSLNHLIKVFDRSGKYLFTIGKRGEGDGEFNFPGYLAFKNHKLYVSDTLNYRVQIFDQDGKFLKKFGKVGDAPGYVARPKGVGADSEGHIYVVDNAFNIFQIFDEDGQLLLWVGSTGRKPGEFQLPSGLYIDQQDRIYVSDPINRRVQVFQYLKETK